MDKNDENNKPKNVDYDKPKKENDDKSKNENDEKLKNDEKEVLACINSDSNSICIVYSDKELRENDINCMKEHNEYYTKLLKTYVENIDGSLKNKKIYKEFFFYMCCGIMMLTTLAIFWLTVIGIIKGSNTANLLVSIGANILSFLASFIVLPKVIANYLFNNEDEKNMVDIVKSIQEYDKEIRNNLK